MDQDNAFLCGLIGAGIGASLTPAMHEEEARQLGLRYSYRRIDLEVLGRSVADLPQLLDGAERLGYAGLNITHPCKQAVLPLLHELSDAARALGAVNTVVLRDGRRIGHNTDLPGFVAGFTRALPDVARRRVVLLGAGGAGAAVGAGLLQLGVTDLRIHDLDATRAATLADRLGPAASVVRELATALADADGLVHCTPTGMTAHPGLPLPAALLRPNLWVAEIVYFPLETELLKAARATGCRTADGSGMAVFQAVEALRLFTGRAPDAARMLRHFAALTATRPATPAPLTAS